MKILMIDKYFFIKGGAERYYFELKDILESHGHQVIPFSMTHPRNFKTPFAGYFVRNIDYNPVTFFQKILVAFRSAGRIVYSFHAKRRLKALIRVTKPDIAHLHMIDHQISPSILHVLKRYQIPVVQTVHTYKHVCPTYRLYHMDKNVICERCLNGAYYHALSEKCHKGSNFATFLMVCEMTVHRLLGFYDRYVSRFLVPSHFMGKKMIQGGISPHQITHLFYTIDVDKYPHSYRSGDYFLYFGRLSAEKGLFTLLKAIQGTGAKLKIAGEGPERKALEAYAGTLKSEKVEFMGTVEGEALWQLILNAQFVAVPSEWYENSPLVIYESLIMGKPVIGARIGGIPELIEHDIDGYLYQAENAGELRQCIHKLLNKKKKLKTMGKAGREKALQMFHPDAHYEALMRIYRHEIKLNLVKTAS